MLDKRYAGLQVGAKRLGTKAGSRYACLQEGMTVLEAIQATMKVCGAPAGLAIRADIGYDVAHGFYTLV
jgi:hypothetical protein